jgi:hypothetical protein
MEMFAQKDKITAEIYNALNIKGGLAYDYWSDYVPGISQGIEPVLFLLVFRYVLMLLLAVLYNSYAC